MFEILKINGIFHPKFRDVYDLKDLIHFTCPISIDW
jgi:hypothetical protein